MRTMMRLFISLVFCFYIVYEFSERIVRGIPWVGFLPNANLLALGLIGVWAGGFFATWSKNPLWTRTLLTGATFLALLHSAVLCTTGHFFGRYFFVGAVLQGLAILKANLLGLEGVAGIENKLFRDEYRLAS